MAGLCASSAGCARSRPAMFFLLADEARVFNQERLSLMLDKHIHDLESRIAALRMEL